MKFFCCFYFYPSSEFSESFLRKQMTSNKKVLYSKVFTFAASLKVRLRHLNCPSSKAVISTGLTFDFDINLGILRIFFSMRRGSHAVSLISSKPLSISHVKIMSLFFHFPCLFDMRLDGFNRVHHMMLERSAGNM